METTGGGWTVIQRRFDGSVDFNRYWYEYVNGFGNLTGEHWLGLKYINQLTNNCNSTLQIELEDFEEDRKHAEYSSFSINSYRYRLSVDGYSSTAGDGLGDSIYYRYRHNGMRFSTKDRDYDNYYRSCAQIYNSGWWFNSCMASNLNGLYKNTPRVSYLYGIIWSGWKGGYFSLKGTEMKVRCQ